ncbi:sugar phosphate nucleotidyltransferase [Legionella busanensis]|nr:sugar phosphate nucleotidyltransferase [Legionella busanensis]
MITTIRLEGGPGSRLWPLSYQYYPKQFLQLYGS